MLRAAQPSYLDGSVRKHQQEGSCQFFSRNKILSLRLSALFQKQQMFWHLALSATHILQEGKP